MVGEVVVDFRNAGNLRKWPTLQVAHSRPTKELPRIFLEKFEAVAHQVCGPASHPLVWSLD